MSENPWPDFMAMHDLLAAEHLKNWRSCLTSNVPEWVVARSLIHKRHYYEERSKRGPIARPLP